MPWRDPGGTRRGPRRPVPDGLARSSELALWEAAGGQSPAPWRDPGSSRRGPRRQVLDGLARSRELYGRLQEASPRCFGEVQRAPGEDPPDALARSRELHGRLQEASPRCLGETQGGTRRGPRRPWHHVIFGSSESRVSLSALPTWSWHASIVLLVRHCERAPDYITKQRIWVGYVPGYLFCDFGSRTVSWPSRGHCRFQPEKSVRRDPGRLQMEA